jgi:hypothetical protein
MAKKSKRVRVLSVSVFRAQYHRLLTDLACGRISRIVLTKRGKRVTAIVTPLQSLRGALKGTVFIPPGADITEPTGEVWEANT